MIALLGGITLAALLAFVVVVEILWRTRWRIGRDEWQRPSWWDRPVADSDLTRAQLDTSLRGPKPRNRRRR